MFYTSGSGKERMSEKKAKINEGKVSLFEINDLFKNKNIQSY